MADHNPVVSFDLSDRDLRREMARIGAEPRGIDLMLSKHRWGVIKLQRVPPPVALLLKQEMLAASGDAATARGTLEGSISYTDLLLIGNRPIFSRLVRKLRGQPYYGLPDLAEEVAQALERFQRVPRFLPLPSGPLRLGEKTLVMGILNLTPDSFYPASRVSAVREAVERAEGLVVDGADLLDVGGESTRPASEGVDTEEELRRVLPALEALAANVDVPISVDTTKPAVARRAVEAGAQMINNTSATRSGAEMARVAADHRVPLVIMHSYGPPKTMQENPVYDSLVSDIVAALRRSVEEALEVGVAEEACVVDPGIGFGKTFEHNREILRQLDAFRTLGLPLMLGASRKSFLGTPDGLPVEERLEPSLAAASLVAMKKVDIVRVHDVRETARAVRFVDAIFREDREDTEPQRTQHPSNAG